MNNDIHDMDDLFRSTLEGYKETPSAGLKERLQATLDKKEKDEYKKRFIIWKRTALLLLLLLVGFVIIESGLLKKGSANYTAQKSGTDTDKIPGDKNKTISEDKNIAVSPVTDKNTNIQPPALQNDKTSVPQNQKNIITIPGNILTETNPPVNSKNKRIEKTFSLFTKNPDPLFSISSPKQVFLISSSQPDKKINLPIDDDNILQTKESGNEILYNKITLAPLSERLTKNILLLPRLAISNLTLKPNNENNSAKKKNNIFIPFWILTPFVSYDQAGYRLDSDEPSAVSSIKFREANEPSYSAGLLLSRQVASRFSLQSGIVYRNTAIGMKPQKTYAFIDPTGDVAYKYITSSGYAFFKPGFGPQPNVGDSLTTAEGKHKLENISIPLLARYTVLNNKISVTPGAGIEANFKTQANLEVDIEDPFNREIVVIRKLNGNKSFYLSFIADAEIKYNLNKKLSLNLRPVYRTAISPITKNNVVETFPRSFGIGAGVTIKL